MRHVSLTAVITSTALLIIASSFPMPTRAGGFNPFREPTTVEKLASEIDKLERHIDHYGTVVAKHPDIWGESRLTQHRDEYEREMAEELSKFKPTLHAQIRTSDQAYLATATLIDSALTTGDTREANPNLSTFIGNINSAVDVEKTGIAERANYAKFQLSGEDTDVVGLEPTIILDQKARYLNHLHELRRIGEGDDTADGPGYAIDLVRIPVSVLPGKKTRKGYGAEITLTASSTMGDELLPVTYRRWMLNDLTHQLSLVMTAVLNDSYMRSMTPAFRECVAELNRENVAWWKRYWWEQATESTYSPTRATNDGQAERYSSSIEQRINKIKLPESVKTKLHRSQNKASANAASPRETGSEELQESRLSDFVAAAKMVSKEIQVGSSVSRTKNGEFPFPVSQYAVVYGEGALLHAGLEAFTRLARAKSDQEFELVHFQDVESYLIEELNGAYRLLTGSGNEALWESCSPELAHAVRALDEIAIEQIQEEFFAKLTWEAQNSTTGLYAWAIIVEAALLNERLVEDMKQTAGNLGCYCISTDWMPFYLPNPPDEARQAFNTYVNCRWPVLTFALDPVTQEQNVGESFSRRREFQLALAVAVATGQLRADQLTRFARRLELDMETIDLNRTIVGFSHGNNNFGWRFFPRVQAPEIDGNLKVAVRDLVFGGPSREADLKSRRIEPGTRECTALIIRPSFIPSLTFDIRSNWFRLSNPGKTEFSLKETVKLSRSIRSMQDAACACVEDQQLYRDGEVYRLLRRVEQLSDELPLQTIWSQVPVENVLGGFRIFAPGATALAPQLYAWYGEPGIDPKNGSALFLVGENFSVQGTRVIVGNKFVDPTGTPNSPVQLISRRIIRIETPKNVQTFKMLAPNGKTEDYVDIHIATPYGVTQHLPVPVATPAKVSTASGYQLNNQKLEVFYCWKNLAGHDLIVQQDSTPALQVDVSNDVKTNYPKVLMEVEFEGAPGLKPTIELHLATSPKKHYVVNKISMINQILKAFNESDNFSEIYPPDNVVLRTSKITLIPKSPDLKGAAIKLDNNLTIIFSRHPSCCPPIDCSAKPSAATQAAPPACQPLATPPLPAPDPEEEAPTNDTPAVDMPAEEEAAESSVSASSTTAVIKRAKLLPPRFFRHD